jgi:spore germination cell wall hydrolase CwlJ-like protein
MRPVNEFLKKCGLIKFLFILMATICFVFTSKQVAYASGLNTTDNQTVQDTSSNNSTEPSANDSTTSTGDTLTLEEGYYLDEQGQVYYDESKVAIEEPVIDDKVAEDTEEEAKEEPKKEVKEETKKTNKDTTKDSSKDTTKKKQNKEKKDKEVKKETQPKKPTYSEADLRLLACLVYSEAGNQSYNGMLGVANVVLNRAKSDIYWHVDTIKEVIYDRKWSVQFAVTVKSSKTGLSVLDKVLKAYDTGKFTGANPEAQKKAMNRAIKAAKDALEGKNNIGKYLCFQNKRSSSSIKRKYSDYKIIGDHIFYRTK